jgi:hypothetical protein
MRPEKWNLEHTASESFGASHPNCLASSWSWQSCAIAQIPEHSTSISKPCSIRNDLKDRARHTFLRHLSHTHAHLRCTSFTFKFQMISQNLEHLELIRILWPGRQVCGSKNSISMSFISCHIQSNVETPSPAGRPRAVATSTHTKLNHFTHDLQKMNATVCLICQYLYLIMSNEVLQHINYNVLQRVISLNWVLWAIQTGFGTRFAALAVVSSRPSMARQGSDAEDMWSSCT